MEEHFFLTQRLKKKKKPKNNEHMNQKLTYKIKLILKVRKNFKLSSSKHAR